MFNFIDIYILIPVSGSVGMGPSGRGLLCPGAYNAVKKALHLPSFFYYWKQFLIYNIINIATLAISILLITFDSN